MLHPPDCPLHSMRCCPPAKAPKPPVYALPCCPQAIKADVSAKRTAAFAKRLLQVAQEAPGHFACGCLLLTSELLKVGGCACDGLQRPAVQFEAACCSHAVC